MPHTRSNAVICYSKCERIGMHSAIDEVLAYFKEWETAESIYRRFTPETVWENVGV